MSDHRYGESEPTENCPYCGATCSAIFVDIGVGYQQCGPYHCEDCGASQIGPYDEERMLTERERSTGWYAPDFEPGSSETVIDGRIVDHSVDMAWWSGQRSDHPAAADHEEGIQNPGEGA